MSTSPEVKDLKISPAGEFDDDVAVSKPENYQSGEDSFEVFKKGEGQVDFRTVGWLQAAVIFLKGMSSALTLLDGVTNPYSDLCYRHPLHSVGHV